MQPEEINEFSKEHTENRSMLNVANESFYKLEEMDSINSVFPSENLNAEKMVLEYELKQAKAKARKAAFLLDEIREQAQISYEKWLEMRLENLNLVNEAIDGVDNDVSSPQSDGMDSPQRDQLQKELIDIAAKLDYVCYFKEIYPNICKQHEEVLRFIEQFGERSEQVLEEKKEMYIASVQKIQDYQNELVSLKTEQESILEENKSLLNQIQQKQTHLTQTLQSKAQQLLKN